MIQITDMAAEKVKEHLKDYPGKSLRIFVEGGGEGCGSGYRFGMAVDEKHDNDHVVAFNDLDVLVDPQSLPFTEALVIDYTERDGESGFELTMPGLQDNKGCGSGGCGSCGSGDHHC
ncbi:MAG: iron-sulfur cluster assembly accessory protein [Chlamydiota bacterium]|nr:iron-sulfur cluster assembly accessory protein [Chlamydiota bacterium]